MSRLRSWRRDRRAARVRPVGHEASTGPEPVDDRRASPGPDEPSGLADRSPEEAPFLDWIRIGADELTDHPDLLGDLLDGRLDGATVTGVLPQETVSRFRATLPALEHHTFDIPEGRTAPQPLCSVTDDHAPYLSSAERSEPTVDWPRASSKV
ncbi:MAG: hypothetical protein AAGK32_18315, partial [Actinomycetota bacterium]